MDSSSVAADQRVVASRHDVVLGEQPVAERQRLAAGSNTQLASQRAVHAFELTQGGVAIAVRGVAAHEREMGELVARRRARPPSPSDRRGAADRGGGAGAARDAPRPTPRSGPAGSSSPPYIASASRAAATSSSASARRASSSNRTTSTVVSASGQSTTLSPRSTTEFGTSMARRAKCAALCSFGAASSIVSSGHTQIDDLLAVQAPAGRHGEHLHERGRVAARPVALGDGHAVDRHRESTEQRDVDRRHRRAPPACVVSHGVSVIARADSMAMTEQA